MKRRRFLLLSAVALLGAACGAPPAEAGLRGSGTVFRPREADVPVASEASDSLSERRAEPTLTPLPRLIPTPTALPLAESDPIVRSMRYPPAPWAAPTPRCTWCPSGQGTDQQRLARAPRDHSVDWPGQQDHPAWHQARPPRADCLGDSAVRHRSAQRPGGSVARTATWCCQATSRRQTKARCSTACPT